MFDGDKNDFYDYFGGKDYRVLHSVWMLVIVSDSATADIAVSPYVRADRNDTSHFSLGKKRSCFVLV